MAGTVLLGVGSPLMGDDGLGLAVLERIQAGWTFEPAVEVRDGGTWGMNLLPCIEDADRLLLVDAIRAGRPPGELVRLDRNQLPRFFATKLSPHQIDLKEVLALAELRGTLPEPTVALGMEPDRVELSAELSPVVRAGLGALTEAVVRELESWGHRAIPVHGKVRPGEVDAPPGVGDVNRA